MFRELFLASLIAFGFTASFAQSAPPPPEYLHALLMISPKVNYQDAKLSEVIADLCKQSQELDPAKKGVKIDVSPGASASASARVSLRLEGDSLIVVIAKVAQLANLTPVYTEEGVLLEPIAPMGGNVVIPSIDIKNLPFEDFITEVKAKAAAAKSNYSIELTPKAAAAAKSSRITLRVKNTQLIDILAAGVEQIAPDAPLILSVADNLGVKISSKEEEVLDPAMAKAKARLEKIIIPKVSFREVLAGEALAQVADLAKAADPQKIGIPLEISEEVEGAPVRITLSLGNATAWEALQYVVNLANFKLETRDEKLFVIARKNRDGR